jgi:hypothetical protein
MALLERALRSTVFGSDSRLDKIGLVEVAKNAEPASWILDRLHPFGQDVGWFIPEGFAAYARVFHPFYRLTTDGNLIPVDWNLIPVRWSDIAAANDRTIAAEMQRLDISAEPTQFSPSGEELWNQQAKSGSLPREIAVRLASILPSHTRTPESCWFAVWEGFGDLRIPNGVAPVVSIPNRDLFLLHGTVDEVLTTFSVFESSYQSPTLWWPDDRAWCVSTEIDYNWSYIGGSAACIEHILNDPELEAIPTSPEQGNWMEK